MEDDKFTILCYQHEMNARYDECYDEFRIIIIVVIKKCQVQCIVTEFDQGADLSYAEM